MLCRIGLIVKRINIIKEEPHFVSSNKSSPSTQEYVPCETY
jgi:hypothetical protein